MTEDNLSALTDLEFLRVGTGEAARSIAFRRQAGEQNKPALVWFGGFRSDMLATKAAALAAFAHCHRRPFVRFDYSGHGESSGCFENGTISSWLEDSLAVVDATVATAPILVGSSMGGWLALLVAQRIAAVGKPPAGLVLIAPAIDFTERLIWDGFDATARHAIEVSGVFMRPSAYGPPVPITRALIEDGRRHLMLGGVVRSHAPLHILQGMRDEDVPWRHALRLVEHLAGDPVVVTLIKDGDHRLSRPQDLERLTAAIAMIA